jgi:hypothetical protein
MNNLQILQRPGDDHLFDVESLLRSRHPNWNEKYYNIILRAREQLIQPNYKIKLIAASIIKESDSARPTWYSYFSGVDDYYKNIFQILGKVIIDNALTHLRARATYKDWIPVVHSLNLSVFLSNFRNLTGFYPELRDDWDSAYTKTIDGYADILSPILKLSPNRAKLFIRNILNEMILQPDKYTNEDLRSRYIEREYILFLAEQNN